MSEKQFSDSGPEQTFPVLVDEKPHKDGGIEKGGPVVASGTSPSDSEESAVVGDGDVNLPSQIQLATLPRKSDKIPIRVYSIGFVEMCERLSYYGTQVLIQNYVQRPLLTATGAAPNPNGLQNNNPGALGRGQEAATGLGTFLSFWCRTCPLLGGWIADTYLGRYKTILIATAFAITSHVVFTIGAAPSVLAQHNGNGALAAFIVATILLGLGTGGLRPNIAPLIAEQVVRDKPRLAVNQRGQQVIIDPAATSARIYHWFYLVANVGSLVGHLAMAFAALYVGYWLAFLLPTITYLFCPLVLLVCGKWYRRTPPSGNVLGPAIRLLFTATKGKWSLSPIRTYHNFNDGRFWEDVKPSNMSHRPNWMTFDDAWVDEVGRGFKACAIFLWFPLYWVVYNQINNNLTSQADTLSHSGIPPEIVGNLDPLALIILIPVFDLLIYPGLRRFGIKVTPIRKITAGFLTAALAMVWAAVLQAYIYKQSACGSYPSETTPSGSACPAVSISIWVQSGSYILIAVSEILASITSLEYAFTKAPRSMRSMVQAFPIFMEALAAALGEAMVPLSADPLLVWNYGAWSVIAFVAGGLFWLCFRGADAMEDVMNALPEGRIGLAVDADAGNCDEKSH